MADPDSRDHAIRDAATVVLVRRDGGPPRVLMGQRGRGAAFMPSKFVFPGGAVDPDDRGVPCARPLSARTAERLRRRADRGLAEALAMAAVRELWEETGFALAEAGAAPAHSVPPGWADFFAAGHWPAADALEFILRAITPPARPRRFDARFFLVDAARIAGGLDDFSAASGELSHLSWLTLTDARGLDLPFITEVVLAEVAARLAGPAKSERPTPFFHHADGKSFIEAL